MPFNLSFHFVIPATLRFWDPIPPGGSVTWTDITTGNTTTWTNI